MLTISKSLSSGQAQSYHKLEFTSETQNYYKQGDAVGSAELQKRVLAASRRLFGDNHADTLRIMTTLAQAMHAQGDLAEARRLRQEVAISYRRLLGDEHPDTQSALANLSQMTGERNLGLVRRLKRLIGWRR